MSTEQIYKYTLQEPLSNKNAGFSKWGYASFDDQTFFIKEFLNPVYPTDDSPYDEEHKRIIREQCSRFEEKRKQFYLAIDKVSDGNLLRVNDFFRWKTKYYIVTKKIESAVSDYSELQAVPMEERLRLCLVILHAMAGIHSVGIVHADIKPSNIIITKTARGKLTAKIIDMDSGFFRDDPPEEIIGDQVYFAPETILYQIGEANAKPPGCEIDIFALGLVLHSILCGELPGLPPDCQYAYQALLTGHRIKISDRIPGKLQAILGAMLRKDPGDRLTAAHAYDAFSGYMFGESVEIPAEKNSTAEAGDTAKTAGDTRAEKHTDDAASGSSESYVSGRLKINSLHISKPEAASEKPADKAPEEEDPPLWSDYFHPAGDL